MARTLNKIKVADIDHIPEWLRHELLNWSRYCWSGAYPHPLPPQTCRSIEKHYQRISEDGDASVDRPIQPIISQALRVQAIWEAMDHLPKQVLRAEYPQRHASGRAEAGRSAAARWLGISVSSYDSALSTACYQVQIGIEGIL